MDDGRCIRALFEEHQTKKKKLILVFSFGFQRETRLGFGWIIQLHL